MKHQLHIVWQHMRRSPYQAAAAIMIMTLTMFVGIALTLISIGSQQVLTKLEQKPQVIAFFNDTISTAEQVAGTVEKLKETNPAAMVKFVSKDQALEIYRERNKTDPLLLELVTANTLPASLEVSAKSVSELPALYEVLKTAPDVEEISYQKDVVNGLISVLDKVRRVGLALMVFLITTSIFTILTIIGMKIALRKDEIDVEKLVGASGSYIRSPFLIEGFLYGIFGAVVSWTVIYVIILVSTPYLSPFLGSVLVLPISVISMMEVLGGAMLIGGTVGVIGSFLAVWRYLKN